MTSSMTIDQLQREREALVRSGNTDAVIALDNELAIERRRADVEVQINAERDAAAKQAADAAIEANARRTLAEAEAHRIVILKYALTIADQWDECAEEMAMVRARIRQAKRTLGDTLPDYSLDVKPMSKDWCSLARRAIKRSDESAQE